MSDQQEARRMGEKLQRYRARRDFRRTPEPRGSRVGAGGFGLRWVIQEHRATTHHFDFRLEDEGVLRSWAVPKGPSMDPRAKRLAMPTEDHPLEYIDFEGVIPSGYGAGTVIVWDTGTYRNLGVDSGGRELPVAEQLARGKITVWLEGTKLRGGFALIRVAGKSDGRWLLIKMADAEADPRRDPVRTQRASVKTGRTLDEVAEAEGALGG
jgi:DNA ligase D-like protein (predicted 3'-phosphoesterase)